MKRITFIFIALVSLIFSEKASSKTPSFTYKAKITSSSGADISNQNINLRFTIIDSSANGTAVYQEICSSITGKDGDVFIEVGNGNILFNNITDRISGHKLFLSCEISWPGKTGFQSLNVKELSSAIKENIL